MSSPHPSLLGLAVAADIGEPNRVTLEVVESAIEHRMHGLLWEWIERVEAPVEADAAELLAMSVVASRRRSRRLRSAAAELTEKLARLDLHIAVFKGIAAEKRWYRAPGDRPAADLDLWLAPHQISRAGDLVASVQPSHPLVTQISNLAAAHQIRSVDLMWKGIPVDLHFDPFKFGVWYEGLDAVWTATEDLGEGYLAMGSAAEFLNALTHLNKDRFSRLLGFVDVFRASVQPGVAVEAWRLAEKIGLSVPIACSAQVVGETLGVKIPIPAPQGGWRSQLWSKLWPEQSRLLGNDGYTQRRHRQDWIPLLCDERFPEAARHLRHVWFPPRDLLDYFNPRVEGLPYPLALLRARTRSR